MGGQGRKKIEFSYKPVSEGTFQHVRHILLIKSESLGQYKMKERGLHKSVNNIQGCGNYWGAILKTVFYNLPSDPQ